MCRLAPQSGQHDKMINALRQSMGVQALRLLSRLCLVAGDLHVSHETSPEGRPTHQSVSGRGGGKMAVKEEARSSRGSTITRALCQLPSQLAMAYGRASSRSPVAPKSPLGQTCYAPTLALHGCRWATRWRRYCSRATLITDAPPALPAAARAVVSQDSSHRRCATSRFPAQNLEIRRRQH